MSKTAKTLLVVFGSIAGIFLLIVAGVWFWWSSNSGNMLKSGGEAMVEGQKHGQGSDEAGCLAAVIARHKSAGTKDISASVVNGLWLRACLEASKPSNAICDGAPPPDEVVSVGKWIGKICVTMGATDPYCPAVLQSLAKYCHGPERAQKVRDAK